MADSPFKPMSVEELRAFYDARFSRRDYSDRRWQTTMQPAQETHYQMQEALRLAEGQISRQRDKILEQDAIIKQQDAEITSLKKRLDAAPQPLKVPELDIDPEE
jgi:hypothetical protein